MDSKDKEMLERANGVRRDEQNKFLIEDFGHLSLSYLLLTFESCQDIMRMRIPFLLIELWMIKQT